MPSQADIYIHQIQNNRKAQQFNPLLLTPLVQIVQQWAGQYLLEFKWSGSFAKGTAIAGSSDIDLFISLRGDVLSGNTPSLRSLYTSLNNWLGGRSYITRQQNVSISINHAGFQVDLVPAVKHPGNTSDHSLYKRKTGTWTKTNIDTHINYIKSSGRAFDIRTAKIWRNLRGLDISSFYLELGVLMALGGRKVYDPSNNFWEVLRFLADDFVGAVIYDPANTNNCVSDELSQVEQQVIANHARHSRTQRDWSGIIW